MVGPVTVFTVENCPYCKQVTTALEECGLPYTEISLSKYPQKRKDLLQLTGKVSVPQMFVHSEWIGGVDAAMGYLRDFSHRSFYNTDTNLSPLETLERQVGRGSLSSSITNPRFMIPIMEDEQEEDETDAGDDCEEPTTGPLETASACNNSTSDATRILTPDGSLLTVLETTELLKKVLDYSQRRWNFTSYKNCCTAEEVIDALCAHYEIPRCQAEAYGRLLHQHKIMHHVCNDHTFRDTAAHFWRLQCFHNPDVLNSYRLWPVEAPPSHPEEALTRILAVFARIERAIIDTGYGGHINYRIAYMCSDYASFEDAVCELQRVDLSLLPEGPARMAFALNVFNLFLKYAFMKCGIPTSDSSRTKLMEQVKFTVGGFTFSLQEWVDGVLRGNRKSPVTKTQAFHKKDPRLQCAIGGKLDCRVHFAIHCWSRSRRSPPVKVFTAKGLNDELALVAQAFCEDDDNVAFNVNDKKMRVAQVFRRYKTDFLGKSGRSVPQMVVRFLYGPRRAKLERYLKAHQTMKMSSGAEDWSLGVSDFVVFDAARLVPNVKKFQKCVRSTTHHSRYPDSSRSDRDYLSSKDGASVEGGSSLCSSSLGSGIGRWLPSRTRRLGGSRSQPPGRDCIPKVALRIRVEKDPVDMDTSERTFLLDDSSNVSSLSIRPASVPQ